MGNKYLPSVKDQKAQQRYLQNQKQKLPAAAKKPGDIAKPKSK